MTSLKQFFYPLIAFFTLSAFALFLFLWLPAIGTSVDEMSANVTAASPAVADNIWGWTWISNGSVVMGLVVALFVGIGLFYLGVDWVKSRFQHG